MQEQSARQLRDSRINALHQASIRNEQFRNATVRSAAHAVPFEPPPEPTIVLVSEDDGSADLGNRNFDVAKWAKKSRSWF